MKFISKNSNLNIILRPGQQAQPITGTPSIPALSVRFQNGMADINDESLVEMMMRHPAFNQDFIAVDETGTDPYAYRRSDSEPQHVTTEMQFGHPVSRNVPPVKSSVPPELKKMIAEQATAIAQEMVKQQLPALVAETLKSLAESSAQQNKEPSNEAKEELTLETASTPGKSNKPKAK